MKRTTRVVLVAGFLGASLIASGAVNRASESETSSMQGYMSVLGDAHMASMQAEVMNVGQFARTPQAAPAQPEAAAYFPAQYVLNAPEDTSGPISTF